MSGSDFEQGMKALKKRKIPNVKLQPDAVDLLAYLCADLNVKLVKETKEAFKSNKKRFAEGMNDLAAEMASKKVIKSQIKNFAVTAAQRYVAKFKANEIRYNALPVIQEYEEELKEAARMKSLVHKPIWHEFYPGINTLLSQTHGERKMDTNTKAFFAEWIYDYILMILETAQSSDRKIGVKEMEIAVRAKLGPELASAAHIEGNKKAQLYFRGMLFLKKDEELHPLVHTGFSPSYWNRSLHYGPVGEPGVVEQRTPEDFSNVFNSKIKRFAVHVGNGVELEARATRLLNDFLENVCSELAHASISKAPPKKKTVGPAEVESAIKDTLRGDMVTFAINEGRKTLVLYGNGFVTLPKLKPQQQQQQPAAKKRKVGATSSPPKKRSTSSVDFPRQPRRIPTIDFIPGIIALAKEMNESMVLDRAVGPSMNDFLQSITDLLSSDLVDRMNVLTVESIKESIVKRLPGRLHDYAIKAGNRAVFPNQDIQTSPVVIPPAQSPGVFSSCFPSRR